MNTQLQRVIIMLFLAITLITVTILFWLPVSNDSDRILAAKESPSGDLLDLPTEAPQSNLPEDDFLTTAAQSEYNADSTGSVAKIMSPENTDADKYAYDAMGNKRAYIASHTVLRGEWFAKIVGEYWDDLFMWPDLYTMNIDNLHSANPDLIFPDEEINIYESLTADGEFSEDDRKTLLSAYLKVYKIYKQLGESKDLAAAQLLASAVRYDKNFLENYSSAIVLADRDAARLLVEEQKFLD